MALNSIVTQVLTDQEPAAGATIYSAEQDLGADAVAMQIWLHLKVIDFAGVPVGNMQIGIAACAVTGQTVFSNVPFNVATVSADATEYEFSFPVTSLPRLFKVAVKNNTNQDVDTNDLQAWIEYVVVT
jgi:hypothetical protein